MTPRVYKTAYVCAMLDTTRTTVRTMVLAGVLESPLRGRISIRSVEAFLEDGRPWQEIAKDRADAKKAKAPNGKKKRAASGGGASEKTVKVTPFRTLTDRGRKLNFDS